MDRQNPFDAMDRMFEQMRRSMMDASRMNMNADMDRPTALPGGEFEMTMPGGGEFEMTTDGDFGMDRGERFGGSHVRMERTDDGFIAIADLPGFEREEITVRFHDGTLSIEAAHEASEEDEMSVRRTTRQLSESVRVPGDVDVDSLEATYRNGILEVSLPTVDGDDEGRVIDVE